VFPTTAPALVTAIVLVGLVTAALFAWRRLRSRIDRAGSLKRFDLVALAGGDDPWNNYLSSGFGQEAKWFRRVIRRSKFNGLGRIADMGSGFGRWALFLAEVNDRVVGFERNNGGVAFAGRLADYFGIRNVDYHVADLTALPADDSSFDGIWFGNILHLTDRAKALGEANRVLRVGGRLAATKFNAVGVVVQKLVDGVGRGGIADPMAQFRLRSLEAGPDFDGFPNYGDPDGVQEILARFGFELDGPPVVTLAARPRLTFDDFLRAAFDPPMWPVLVAGFAFFPWREAPRTVNTNAPTVDFSALAARLRNDEAFRDGFMARAELEGLPMNIDFAAIKTRDLTAPGPAS
jgi:SAM-dependent methyltransferase